MAYVRDEGDEAVAPDFVLLSLRAVVQAALVIQLAIAVGLFIGSGNPVVLILALLIGFAWARL